MGKAIGIAVVIIVLAIVVPEVVNAISDFITTVLAQASQFVASLKPPR